MTLLFLGLPLLFGGAAHPVLVANCTKCHGGAKQKGELDLGSVESVLRGGESGPAIVPGKPTESLLIQAVLAEVDC